MHVIQGDLIMPKLNRVCPYIPAGDNVNLSIDYYVNKLGFELKWKDSDNPSLALVGRDTLEFFLQYNPNTELAEWFTFRVEVNNIDQLYNEFLQKDKSIIHRNGKLDKKPWGSHDFSIEDPQGVCITFYEYKQGRDLEDENYGPTR